MVVCVSVPCVYVYLCLCANARVHACRLRMRLCALSAYVRESVIFQNSIRK